MRKLAVEQAVGETLCHDMTAILENGFKGVRFSRGHVIREEDIEALRDMGKRHVFVWEPQADEVHEDDAAAALVDALTAQLAVGGTLVAPVGPSGGQSLLCLRKTADGGIEQDDLGPVVFVPLLSGVADR